MTGTRIGFLAHTTGWGGAEQHTVAVSRTVAARGHQVVIVQLGHELYSRHAGFLPEEGIAMLAEGAARTFSVLGWRRLFHRHRIGRVVLVKGTFGVQWTVLDLAVLLGRIPMITIEHQFAGADEVETAAGGLGFWRMRVRARRALHRAAAHRVVAVSRAIAGRLIEAYGFDPARVSVVSNGVDPTRFLPDPLRRRRARARWGVPEDTFVFGFLGRMSQEKRIDRLLEAFGRMRENTTAAPCMLVLIGAGPAEANLKRLAGELGISESCRWPGPTARAWEEYPGFDAFVVTSDREGLPFTVIEAMACALPVVAVDIPGVRELVLDGETGLVTKTAPEDLASAMSAMVRASPDARQAWGSSARDRVVHRHDGRRAAEAVAELVIDG